MAESLTRLMKKAQAQLRYVKTLKRIRVTLGGAPVADTTRAALVWEPRRIVGSYAVPEADIVAPLLPDPAEAPAGSVPLVLDPGVPFAVHTTAGDRLTVSAGGATGGAFRLADPDLAGYVVLDFPAFDWLEEDEPLVGHPRDPYNRIDVCPSSRTIQISHEGVVLAETSRAMILFEGTLPVARYYMPKDDVRVRLEPGTLHTTCAYKGHATHWTARADGLELPDVAWSYEEPLHDGERVKGRVSFYNERLDVTIDGEKIGRPVTPWSR